MAKNIEKAETIVCIDEEEEPGEEWCFECKDGGQMVICDHRNCGKVYHPDCVGRDDSFFDSVKSWVCGRHSCSDCNEPPKFCCLGCPNAVCKKCVAASEFTVVRGFKGLCIDCWELVEIIEQNLDHDSEGNKISLDDRETYECLFKEYWEIIKVKEGLTSDAVSAAQSNYKKGKKFLHHKKFSEGEEEKQNDLISWDSDEDSKPAKRKRKNSEEFVGWGSKPLISFLASIGKYETEPLTHWGVTSLIHEYIKERNLRHPKDKGKFLPDERLFPIFRKKVMSKSLIYSRLEFHFAKKLDDSSVEKSDDQIKKISTDKHLNDQATCTESRLSCLIGKPPLKKGDFFIKLSRFASTNANNINLIYLKQSLVLELSKQPESFMGKVVGTFVRAKMDSNDSRQRKSHHLVRVLGVEFDEMSNGTLLQVSFMAKAIPISELSDEEFTEQECEDLRQKVNSSLLPKLTVLDHTKIALLEEREKLEQSWKQEQLLRRMPSVSVRPEFIEAQYDDSEENR
ncbi:Zinc finger CCCH domain-containing protein 44 [Spatholobus suberectus]|nr:Zinc finger CCCH domain-containing protein 44 [Spatholobus suberectus]